MQGYKSPLWNGLKKPVVSRSMAAHPESTESVAARLELTRRALGYESQTEFSTTLPGMTPQKWNNYEKGRDRIPVDAALALCARFSLSLDWIYRGLKDALPMRLVRQLEEIGSGGATPARRGSKTP